MCLMDYPKIMNGFFAIVMKIFKLELRKKLENIMKRQIFQENLGEFMI